MQKKLLAVAVAGALALPASAMAVEVFGTIDTGLRQQSKAVDTVNGGDDSNLVVTDGLRTTNRWGFRGSEDLGGGLMANFWFEGQYNSDTGGGPVGAGLFQRKNLVGLSKGGMSIDLGRDYTVNFKSQGIYDPMSYTYTGITPAAGTNTAGVRFSNLVTAGFRFGTGGIRVDYSTGTETVGSDNGQAFGFNADFAIGPVTLTGAFSSVDTTAAVANAVSTSTDTTNFGGAYRLGAFTIRAGWSNTEAEQAAGGKTESPMLTLGLQYAISPTMNARLGYYSVDTENTAGVTTLERTQFIAALDYYLSKRTTLYVALDRLSLDAPAGTPSLALGGAQSGALLDGATGISAGVAHSF